MNDRVAVATYLTGKAPTGRLTPVPEANACSAPFAPATDAGPGWNGWGRDLANTRFQSMPGLTAAEVPHLKLKWAFGYRATYVYGQPTLVGWPSLRDEFERPRVLIGCQDRLHLLDLRCCGSRADRSDRGPGRWRTARGVRG